MRTLYVSQFVCPLNYEVNGERTVILNILFNFLGRLLKWFLFVSSAIAFPVPDGKRIMPFQNILALSRDGR